AGWPAGHDGTFYEWIENRPLWLGVTGTGGYYPLSILNPDASERRIPGLHALQVGRPPYVTMLLLLLVALVSVVHAASVVYPRLAPSRFRDEFDFTNKADAITAAKGACHSLALVTLALGVLLASSSFLFFRNAPYSVNGISIYKVGAAIAILLPLAMVSIAIWLLYSLVFLAWRISGEETKLCNDKVINIARLVRGVVLVFLIFLAPVVFWFAHTSSTTYDNAFLHYRDLYVASGVAPNLPGLLLVTVGYLGILTYLRRV